jgi:hypothetical protein
LIILEVRSRPLFWALAPLPTNPIVPTDLERCRESEQGRRQMFLAFAALSPALPVSSVISGAAIAVCFAPGEDCTAFAVRAIDNAESEILVSAYGLTTGSGIGEEALVRAKGRGVDVRLSR